MSSQVTRSTGEGGVFIYDIVYSPLVPCLELYSDNTALAAFFSNPFSNTPNFSTTDWQCLKPDQDVIVQNDVWVSPIGISTNQIVDSCQANLLGLDASGCITDASD